MRKEVKDFRERTSGKIKLISVNQLYRNIPFTTVPLWDEKRQEFGLGGQEEMTAAELKKCPVTFDPEQHFTVSHNETLDLSIPKQREKAAILMFDQKPFIVPSAKDVKEGETIFYIEDREVESKNISSTADQVMEALQFVTKMKADDLKDYCMLLGLPTNASLSIMEGNLKKMAMDNPSKILGFKNSKYDEKLFILKLLENGTLKKDRKNYIWDNEVLVGRNLDDAVLFTRDKENEKVVDLWRRSIVGKRSTKGGSKNDNGSKGETGGDKE